jgi:hypothetical protein
MKTTKLYGRFYTSDPQEIGQFEKEWAENLCKEIENTSPYPYNLVINVTWFFEKGDTVNHWLSEFPGPADTKIWLCGSIDSAIWIKTQDWYNELQDKGYEISIVGFSDEHWHSWFPYWLYKHNKDIDIRLNQNPKYLYLSYNRKPRDHRIELIKNIIDDNLLERGYVTFEKGMFAEIDNKTANTELGYYSNLLKTQPENYIKGEDTRYTRPEDLTSLGNLEIWNNSYLVISSESEKYDLYHLSEKTWKPILGLRPFVLNSNHTTSVVLKKLGFYAPSDLFEDSSLDECSISSIISLIKKLYSFEPEKLFELYKKQLSMLEHNRSRFLEIAEGDRSKILNWAQQKNSFASVWIRTLS